MSLNAMDGLESAILSTAAHTAVASVTSFLRNFLLAGTFAKSSSTITVVPVDAARSVSEIISPPTASSAAPTSASAVFEIILILDTDAIAARASPLNPSVIMPSRSLASFILLVA